jgi:hypothetical protein
MMRFSYPAIGVWGIRQGHVSTVIVCTPSRVQLCSYTGKRGFGRRRVLATMDRAEALGLLCTWGFESAEIWQADDFCQRQIVISLPKLLTLHEQAMAEILLNIEPRDAHRVQ